MSLYPYRPKSSRSSASAARNVRIARELIEATPDEFVGLKYFIRNSPCGTIACAAGHLALSGVFGLTFTEEPVEGHLHSISYRGVFFEFDAIKLAMGLDHMDAENLFQRRDYSEFDEDIYEEYKVGLSDKELFLARCDHWLRINGHE